MPPVCCPAENDEAKGDLLKSEMFEFCHTRQTNLNSGLHTDSFNGKHSTQRENVSAIKILCEHG